MNVRPLHDRLVVRRIAEGEQRHGRIIIPESAKEKPQQGGLADAVKVTLGPKGRHVILDNDCVRPNRPPRP